MDAGKRGGCRWLSVVASVVHQLLFGQGSEGDDISLTALSVLGMVAKVKQIAAH